MEDPSGTVDPRFNDELLAEVFDVLSRHGYKVDTENPAALQGARFGWAVQILTRVFEGKPFDIETIIASWGKETANERAVLTLINTALGLPANHREQLVDDKNDEPTWYQNTGWSNGE